VRLEEAMAFFYPRSDWEAGQADAEANLPRLEVVMGVLSSSERSFSKLEDLKQASLKSQQAT
jgi:hypothetical protein